jgi:hypothetical protein
MPFECVNPVTIWASLPPDIQAQIGATAIANELAGQGATSDFLDLNLTRAFERADSETGGELTDLITLHCPDAFRPDGEPLLPDLNALGIRQCHICGCTDNYGCPAGCCWTGPTTCSACAPAPVTPPSDEPEAA